MCLSFIRHTQIVGNNPHFAYDVWDRSEEDPVKREAISREKSKRRKAVYQIAESKANGYAIESPKRTKQREISLQKKD